MKKANLFLCFLAVIFITCCNNNHVKNKVNESDQPTDKNIIAQPGLREKAALKTCADVAFQIMETSPVVKKMTKGLNEAIIKNGGSGIETILEGSPNPKNDGALDYSASYDFALHESYSDRMPLIGRFQFNPVKRQLYKYDTAEDTLYPIAFDKSLLAKFDELCK
jgi:hypothetical protein